MGKIKGAATSYAITTGVFWFLFMALVVFNKFIARVIPSLQTTYVGNMTTENFIGIIFLMAVGIALIFMLQFASLLSINSQHASASNYKAEAGWALTVFILNLVFTLIFVAWFTMNILFNISAKGRPISDVHPAVIENKILFSFMDGEKPLFSVRISTILNWLAVLGVFCGIVAFAFSITITQRASDVAKKIKEYEKVNIY